MKSITKYVAKDGAEFESAEQCIAREVLVDEVADIMKRLPKPPEDALRSGKAFYQHSAADVLSTQAALARAYLARWDDCNGHIQWVVDATRPAGETFFGRILDDSDRANPIRGAWHRIMCIDSQFREWEQPYYTRNPEPGARPIKRSAVNGDEQ